MEEINQTFEENIPKILNQLEEINKEYQYYLKNKQHRGVFV